MDKFGAFSNPDADCISCKDDQVFASTVNITVKPTGDHWTPIEKVKINSIFSEHLNTETPVDFSKKEILILETINPTLANFIFVKVIELGLNTSFKNT